MKRSRLARIQESERLKNERTYRRNTLMAVIVLALFFSLIVTPVVYKWLNPPMLSPLGRSIEVKAVEVTTPKEITWNDAIREVFPVDEAGKMIRICMTENKAQSPYAMNINTNKTYDYSWCQVNSCHKPKSMTDSEWMKNLEDPRFNAQQVRKIYLSQGWSAWVVYNKGLVK